MLATDAKIINWIHLQSATEMVCIFVSVVFYDVQVVPDSANFR